MAASIRRVKQLELVVRWMIRDSGDKLRIPDALIAIIADFSKLSKYPLTDFSKLVTTGLLGLLLHDSAVEAWHYMRKHPTHYAWIIVKHSEKTAHFVVTNSMPFDALPSHSSEQLKDMFLQTLYGEPTNDQVDIEYLKQQNYTQQECRFLDESLMKKRRCCLAFLNWGDTLYAIKSIREDDPIRSKIMFTCCEPMEDKRINGEVRTVTLYFDSMEELESEFDEQIVMKHDK